jgi:uncharacterized iron-regulated membrane protein
MRGYPDQSRHAGVVYGLMLVVALAFGGFVWQLYAGPEAARIPAPTEPYKIEPRQAEAPTEAPPEPAEADAAAPGGAAPVEADGPPRLGSPPVFVGNGPYVAQLAALRSEDAVGQAWQRLAARAPDLFAPARLDVEEADLGARGIYYRVRAGYFADRANAMLFCDRIRQMGQDCIVSAR